MHKQSTSSSLFPFTLQGLLQLNGSCVPSEDCGCVYLQHQAAGKPPSTITVPQGGTITIDCSTWWASSRECLLFSGPDVQHCQPEQQQEVPPSTLVCVGRESMYSSPGHSPAIFFLQDSSRYFNKKCCEKNRLFVIRCRTGAPAAHLCECIWALL